MLEKYANYPQIKERLIKFLRIYQMNRKHTFGYQNEASYFKIDCSASSFFFLSLFFLNLRNNLNFQLNCTVPMIFKIIKKKQKQK